MKSDTEVCFINSPFWFQNFETRHFYRSLYVLFTCAYLFEKRWMSERKEMIFEYGKYGTRGGRSKMSSFCWMSCVNREFTQHDAPADDEPKKSRNERGHAILSQALARI